jgi:hypothetical protein
VLRVQRFLRAIVGVLSGIAIYSACPPDWHPALVALATGLGAAFCMQSLLGLPLAAWAAHVGLGIPWYLASLIYISPAILFWIAAWLPEKKEGQYK